MPGRTWSRPPAAATTPPPTPVAAVVDRRALPDEQVAAAVEQRKKQPARVSPVPGQRPREDVALPGEEDATNTRARQAGVA